MTALEEARSVVTKLSPEERRRLLEWLAHEPAELAPGIFCTPDVCGGEPCVGPTRIPVALLESYRREGMPDADLLAAYPSLNREDLRRAWAYTDTHRPEMDQLIAENESDEQD